MKITASPKLNTKVLVHFLLRFCIICIRAAEENFLFPPSSLLTLQRVSFIERTSKLGFPNMIRDLARTLGKKDWCFCFTALPVMFILMRLLFRKTPALVRSLRNQWWNPNEQSEKHESKTWKAKIKKRELKDKLHLHCLIPYYQEYDI